MVPERQVLQESRVFMNKNSFMYKLERKLGRYAIQNLTLILIACYIVGYIIQLVNPTFLNFLSLNPERIVHGQVWRIFTWLIIPPSSMDLFTILMLYFYYSIGTLMERTLGTFRYNVYLVGGMLMTIAGAFLCFGLYLLFPQLMGEAYQVIAQLGGDTKLYFMDYFAAYSFAFSTYYINISIFLAFATCYPEMQVLLLFVIPVKVKWMGYLDLGLLVWTLISGNLFTRFAVGAALLNFFLFWLSTKNLMRIRPAEIKRRAEFRNEVKKSAVMTRHKCAICGVTEEMEPDMEFRFCSKCEGAYEYCSRHLYTHEHVKKYD